MATWLQDIVAAFKELGGIATWEDIYNEVGKTRTIEHTQTIRRIVLDHSSDSEGYKSGEDLFFSVSGVGKGVWGLRGYSRNTPVATDIEPPGQPDRIKIEVYRTLRDTKIARTVKKLHRDRCQICGESIILAEGKTYSEAHHIKPLGAPHSGPDSASNIIVLCPNHHVLCDYGAIRLSYEMIEHHPNHVVGQQYLTYHNSEIFSGA